MYSQQLKTFILVADRGSLTKAAEDLFVTPASVMKQMNAFEKRLDLTLFKRTSRGVQLTEAGKYIYQAGRKIIDESGEAVRQAKAIEQKAAKTIRIGSSLLNPAGPLLDLFNRAAPSSFDCAIQIVPFSDDHEQILSVVRLLGQSVDFLAGVFCSRQILETAQFFELGQCRLCVAVPKTHRLAGKSRLTLKDLHGERLIIVQNGDSLPADRLRKDLERTHPQILFEETSRFYDLDTFNNCGINGSLLLTIDLWKDIHPSLITIPVDWEYTVPYGILYAKDPSEAAAAFLEVIQNAKKSGNPAEAAKPVESLTT